MSVNVLGQNVTTTWSRLKHPDLHMLSLSHAHLEAYRAAVNGVSEQSILPPLSYQHHQPSSSTLGLPFDHHHPSHLVRSDYGPAVATGGLSPWNILNLDRARKLGSVTGHTKVPVSIVSSNEKTRSTSNDESSTLTRPYLGKNGDDNEGTGKVKSGSSKRSESKSSREGQSSSRKDYPKCQLSKSQMNGLPDKISMTGSGGPTNADHLTWLADVTTGSRGSAPQRPNPREPSSPGGGHHHQTGTPSSVGGLAHPADNIIGSGSSSLFRPPIPSAPSTNDLYPAQFALPGPSSHLHHRGSMSSGDSNMAAYYNHVPPHHFSPFYSPRYSPTAPYPPLTAQSSPGLVPQQFFPVDSFSGSLQQSAIDGARVSGGHHPSQASTLQLPHSRSYAHHHNSLISSQSSYPGSGLGKPKLSGGSVLYDERHSSIKDKVPSSMLPKPDKKNHLLNPLTMKLSGKPLDMNANNGLEQQSRHDFSVGGIKSSLRTGGCKDSSLKHRILRPGNITITEPPSSVLGDAPLSAPPLRTTYKSDIPSSKYPRLSTPTAFTHSRQRSPLPPIIKLPKDNTGPPVPNFVPTSTENRSSFGTTHFQFPAYFKKGSIIQLANNSLRRVEDLTTEDFLQSASLSPDLSIDSSTVVKVEESIDRKSAILGFSVGHSKVQVSVETPLEHPFFVFSRGWSSCSPERSLQQYGLTCQKLKIGDVCVSLTHKNLNKGSKRQGSPASTSVSITVTEPIKSVVHKVLDSSSVRPKSSSTMPKEELPVTTSSNSEGSKDKCVAGSRKRRSSAPANLNLDQMPSNTT